MAGHPPRMAKLLGNPGILGQGGAYDWPSRDNPGILGQGGYMAGHPGIIPGWSGYLGIPGYLDKGGAYGWPSWDNPGMAKLLGNPGILGQGGGHMAGHPGIIPGWPSYLGIPGY